ncbi:MAG: MlaD family protein [candidate division WOR-3 bacterium]
MKPVKFFIVIVFLVLAVTLIILSYFGLSGKLKKAKGYEVTVYFKEVSGLKIGAPVMVRGIEKGKVLKITLDSSSKFVSVKVLVSSDVILTEDSYFAIRALSYFGTDKFVNITPGSGKPVKSNFTFYGTNEVLEMETTFTQLKNIIGKLESIPVGEIGKHLTILQNKLDSVVKTLSFPLTTAAEGFSRLTVKFDSLRNFFIQEGTITKLIKSDDLYEEIRRTNNELNELLVDIKRNPQKYFTLKLF